MILLKGKNPQEVNNIKGFLNRLIGTSYDEEDFTEWAGLTNEYSILLINGMPHYGLDAIKKAIL